MTTADATDAALGALFGQRTATVVPDAVAPAAAAALRGDLAAAGWARYALYDRGSYEVIDDAHARALVEAALGPALRALAERVTGRPWALAEARALRLRAGDYLLAHHDDRVHEGLPLEAVIDVSAPATPAPGAEVHYRRRGQVFFRIPAAPGAIALVERGPTVTCNHTYLTRRAPNAEVVRVIALLR